MLPSPIFCIQKTQSEINKTIQCAPPDTYFSNWISQENFLNSPTWILERKRKRLSQSRQLPFPNSSQSKASVSPAYQWSMKQREHLEISMHKNTHHWALQLYLCFTKYKFITYYMSIKTCKVCESSVQAC